MTSEQLELPQTFAQNSEMSNTKLKKIKCAMQFAGILGNANLKFVGISGSVSYEPMEEDDIDIFIITENGKLWQTLLRAFLVRRISGLSDICISLCMEQRFAEVYYGEIKDSLILEDSLHVIPIFGTDFYEYLVSRIQSSNEGALKSQRKYPDDSGAGFISRVASFLSFIPLATFLFLKGSFENFRLLKSGRREESFTTVVALDRFYLDSDKYRRLRRTREVIPK